MYIYLYSIYIIAKVGDLQLIPLNVKPLPHSICRVKIDIYPLHVHSLHMQIFLVTMLYNFYT